VQLPPGLPAQARESLSRAIETTFHQGFTDAMKVTLILPVAVLVSAALSCLFIKSERGAIRQAHAETAAEVAAKSRG
jgi:hypothetical protein